MLPSSFAAFHSSCGFLKTDRHTAMSVFRFQAFYIALGRLMEPSRVIPRTSFSWRGGSRSTAHWSELAFAAELPVVWWRMTQGGTRSILPKREHLVLGLMRGCQAREVPESESICSKHYHG